MKMQLRFMTKDETHKLIDDAPGNKIMTITFYNETGISHRGKMTEKRKGKKMVDKANTIVLSETDPFITVSLYKSAFTNFDEKNIDKVVKAILLTKYQQPENRQNH